MKRKIGLALATGLALLVAGCASQSSSGGASTGGGGGAGANNPAMGNPSVAGVSKNFNLAVKCPGVHWEKKHGWSDQQIMQQESVEQEDIPACEQWVQAQPKGYVPPPPGGGAPAGGPAPAGGTPAPGTAKQ
jgi:hypothetical protein